MPRVRGFRDPRTLKLPHKKLEQIERLQLPNYLRVTTSRLPASLLEEVLRESLGAYKQYTERNDSIKSPNHGQIVAVKDNFVTKDLPTTCASNILKGFAAEDATAVKLLKDAGMSVVAKTNMDEFGMGSHSTNSAYGAVRNGISTEAFSAGGSSGGSALAVATKLVDSALGSDTGGSVRLPAAYTTIVGFKPSYGRISRKGLIPYANSLDTVGIFGRTAVDVWILFSLLDKYDSQDPTSLSPQTRQRIEEARRARVPRNSKFRFTTFQSRQDLSRDSWKSGQEPEHQTRRQESFPSLRPQYVTRRIGVPVEYNIAELHPVVRRAWIRTLSNLQYMGHKIVPISLPSTQQALSAYYVLAPAEASSNLAKYDGVRYGKLRKEDVADDANGVLYSEYRGALFGDEVQRRILLGSFTLSAGAIDNYFIQAQKVRRLVQYDFDAVFRMANPLRSDYKPFENGIDYIICPTAPTPPPRLSEINEADPLDTYVNDVFTVPASLAGLPAISVPAYQDHQDTGGIERAVGMQVIGQFGDDGGVIHFARRWMERDYHYQKPRTEVIKGPSLR